MTVADTVSKVAKITEEVVTDAHIVAPVVEAGLDALALWPGFGTAAIAAAAVRAADSKYAVIMSTLEELTKINAGEKPPDGADLSKASTQIDMHLTPGLPNIAALSAKPPEAAP